MKVIAESAIAAAQGYNEAEVRFHIIDPIIRLLGYPDSDNTYLILEEKLEYPFVHIGRRSKKDVPLGISDYRAGIKGVRGSFVVEAKGGSVDITAREVEQAHSYAAHAQVGANYFVLCNGSVFVIHETLSGPQAPPLVEIPLTELNARFHEIENILAPLQLERNCQFFYDRKLKLAPGLASSVRIRSGRYLLSDCNVKFLINNRDVTEILRKELPKLAEMDRQIELLRAAFEMRVSDGHVRRGDDGKILAHVNFDGVTVHHQQAMEIMGINEASFVTADEFLSSDPSQPTIFESLTDFSISRGTVIPQLFGDAAELDGELQGEMFIKIGMHLDDGQLVGEYKALSEQRFRFQGTMPMTVEIDTAGTFKLALHV